MWTFESSTGKMFWPSSDKSAQGYSGHGEGKNKPLLQTAKDVGPIPTGIWHIGPAFTHPHLGPLVMPLLPAHGTNTYGRDHFYIHGENASRPPGLASKGCIVLDHWTREAIADGKDRLLVVVSERPATVLV